MDGQPPAVEVIRLVAEQIEKLTISSGTLVFPHSSHTRADSLSSNDVLEPMCAIAKSMILSVQRSVFLQSITDVFDDFVRFGHTGRFMHDCF